MKLPMQTVARRLNLPVSTLVRWIRQGSIPIQRSGADVIFTHAALEKWAATHNLPFSQNGGQADDRLTEAPESLLAAMRRGKVCRRVTGADAAAVLRSAVDGIDFLSADVRDELFDKLIQREGLASTGIGNGIAIPHPRDPLSQAPEKPVIATCFLEKPVHFNAIDDQPVSVLFLLISPTIKHHLHLLSRLSFCIRDKAFVAFLGQHPEAAALFSRIAEFEKQLDDL